MPQDSITPEQKGQAVNLGGMMAHVEAVMQRFNSEVTQPGLQGKVDDVIFDSSTGELRRTKNGTSDKVCDIYTKSQVDAMRSPSYNPATKRYTFPANATFEYQAASKKIILSH